MKHFDVQVKETLASCLLMLAAFTISASWFGSRTRNLDAFMVQAAHRAAKPPLVAVGLGQQIGVLTTPTIGTLSYRTIDSDCVVCGVVCAGVSSTTGTTVTTAQ